MKYLKNHHYVLLAHILICAISLAISLSTISIISISITIMYFVLIKYIRRNSTINYLIQLAIFCTIPFCYTTGTLIEKYLNTDWGSIIPLFTILMVFFIAIKIPNSRKESIINVRSRYTEGDTELRKKANVFMSRTLYVSIVPYFILIIYFKWTTKLGLTIFILLLMYIVIWGYTSYIGKRKIVKVKHSVNA